MDDTLDIIKRRVAAATECREIENAICYFFSTEKWQEFIDASPDDLFAYLSHLKAEWQRIYDEFMVIA